MKKPKELKKQALDRLICCWGESCAVFFIILGELLVVALALRLSYDCFVRSGGADLPVRLAAVMAALLGLGLWLAVTPFAYGVCWYRIQQIRGNAVFARSMFSCYASLKKMLQVLKLSSMLALRRLPLFIPITAAVFAGFYFASGTVGYAGAIVLAAAGLCLFAFLGLKYAPAPYLYALEPASSPKEIIAESKRIMKNNSRYIVGTMYSMAGWLLPCILIFPMIFILPYSQMVYTAAINEIIEQDGKKEIK